MTSVDEVIMVQVARLNEHVEEILVELKEIRADLDEIRAELDVLRPPEDIEDLVYELTGVEGNEDA